LTARLRRGIGALTCLALLAFPPPSHSASCAAPAGFTNEGVFRALQRGVNLPGWDHEDPARRPTPTQLRALRDAGFTHIRLPIDHRPLEGSAPQAYLDALHEQVVLLRGSGFLVSLDLHAGGTLGPRFLTDPVRAEAGLADLWDGILSVARFFGPEAVALELLNEPEMEQDIWMDAAGRLIARIRRILPDHTIILGPSGPQRHETLADMIPFGDRNIVYAVHYYDPFPFTHQGANWGKPDDPLRVLADLPFPAIAGDPAMEATIAELKAQGHDGAADLVARTLPWNEAGIEAAFDTMAHWAKTNARPVIVNEFGVLDFATPRRSRLDWLAAVARAASSRCIGWAHWDFQDGFGLIDHKTGLPDAEIVEALMAD